MTDNIHKRSKRRSVVTTLPYIDDDCTAVEKEGEGYLECGTADYSFNCNYSDIYSIEDVENRHLYLNGEIDENIIDTVVYHILRYNRIDFGKPIEERDPIMLYLNTPGGNIVDGFALVDAISVSKTPIYTINLGMAASMGFLVFISGHKRYAMPRSRFLLHDGMIYEGDSLAKANDRFTFEVNQFGQEIQNLILEKTLITKRKYNEMYRTEWYFLPKEGKKIGAVDYIIGQDCDIEEIIWCTDMRGGDDNNDQQEAK